MKTGGTSMDSLIRCALTRWQKVLAAKMPTASAVDSMNTSMIPIPSSASIMPVLPGTTTTLQNSIPYTVIHECSAFMYARCRSGEDVACQARVNQSSVLSYCAPLMDLNAFGWQPPPLLVGQEEQQQQVQIISKSKTGLMQNSDLKQRNPHVITVLRHPVDRVWSMFRFKTKMCFSCRNLTDIYDAIARGENLKTKSCQDQLFDHQTRNLVSTWQPNNTDQMLDEATYNIKHYVTFLGMTANMNDTAKMVGVLFPFLNETISQSNDTCPMPHRNASPLNNGCLPNRRHWELPPHPDEATVQAILKYNAMDVQLYERALLHFEYQKRALGLVDEE
jgi:Sulfotransferase family